MFEDEVRALRSRGPGAGEDWTYVETILAYLCLTYLDPSKLSGTRVRKDGTSSQAPAVATLSGLLGRTDGSVVLKIMNLRSEQTEGVRGMSGGSVMDRRVVAEYGSRLDELLAAALAIAVHWPGVAVVMSALELSVSLETRSPERDQPFNATSGPTERVSYSKSRVGQSLFRSRVLQNYSSRCACCGLTALSRHNHGVFLVAGHIRPWSQASDHERLDPRNGILFCSIHDRAFEHGLMTVDGEQRIQISARVPDEFGPQEVVQQYLGHYHGARLESREHVLERPLDAHLEFHRQNVFESFARQA